MGRSSANTGGPRKEGTNPYQPIGRGAPLGVSSKEKKKLARSTSCTCASQTRKALSHPSGSEEVLASGPSSNRCPVSIKRRPLVQHTTGRYLGLHTGLAASACSQSAEKRDLQRKDSVPGELSALLSKDSTSDIPGGTGHMIGWTALAQPTVERHSTCGVNNPGPRAQGHRTTIMEREVSAYKRDKTGLEVPVDKAHTGSRRHYKDTHPNAAPPIVT